jgi:biopolymer transport protein ExbD
LSASKKNNNSGGDAMSKKKKKKKQDKPEEVETSQDEGFGLAAPSERIEEFREDEKPFQDPSVPAGTTMISHPQADDSVEFKNMGWKGIDNEEEEIEEEFAQKKEPIPEDELDMTPMVDVTFLLLIFFMVTASFTLQKSISQPPAQTDEPTLNNVEEEIEDDYVEVIIDQTNTFYVTTRDTEEQEAPSEREMRSLVKDAKDNSTATRMVIKAHVDSMHRKVVTAWDAGIAVGMDKIEVQTTEEDY